MGKIRSGGPHLPAEKIQQQTPQIEGNIVFSFRHLDFLSNPKFSLNRCRTGYLEKLLERLKNLNAMTVKELKETKSKSIRIHSHDWNETSEKQGFAFLNEQLRDLPG